MDATDTCAACTRQVFGCDENRTWDLRFRVQFRPIVKLLCFRRFLDTDFSIYALRIEKFIYLKILILHDVKFFRIMKFKHLCIS